MLLLTPHFNVNTVVRGLELNHDASNLEKKKLNAHL